MLVDRINLQFLAQTVFGNATRVAVFFRPVAAVNDWQILETTIASLYERYGAHSRPIAQLLGFSDPLM